MTETQLQIAAMKWIRSQRGPNGPWHAIHVPNEGFRAKKEGAIQLAKGVLRGVSDIHIFEPYNNRCGIVIELKKPGSGAEPSPSQRLYLRAMHERCWTVGVAESLLEVKMICQDLVNWCKINNP